ncbi:RNA-binding protein [Synechococcus sp. Nb3U1]|uniref:RNA recognition motif domain-containing protein n=1 Tax=Synechococcus sp. Nb3U1 TaxID=1914529 RepID=UPI001F3436CD|nr:RNA-binding protein [Synechococcus sp. Nb3U1]MCF2971454.1 RNA-binding protein [Synechococcus sp. Nb3U1]
MTIFVGNLNYKASTEELTAFFQQRWNVKSVTIPTDRETGQTRGFAFVDLATDAEEDEAIDSANGEDFMGRPLRLDRARPRRQA